VTILNEADTGRPLSIINTTLISAIRTAAVSGFFIREIVRRKTPRRKFNIGMSGFGMIGRMHLEMIHALLGDQLGSVHIFDIRPETVSDVTGLFPNINVVASDSWHQAYEQADIFVTCTVSSDRYIDKKPSAGSIHLNVSLRDYLPELRHYMNYIVVDNWEEVCRENTDIERMHLTQGLQKTDTLPITSLVGDSLPKHLNDSDVVMFNPMGMAVYDIAVATYYYNRSIEQHIGINLQ
jgi:ornithine cyclodeaminase